MGRLDDHAKRRIVELRRAGLSFHKIKKVLELDDIHVMLQAVYLFLKRKSMEPGLVAALWDRDQPQPPLRGQEPKLPKLAGPWPPAVPGGDPLVSQGPIAGPDTKEGTQGVSPASLCQGGGQSSEALPMGLPPRNGDGSSTGALSGPGIMASTHQPLPSRERPSAPPARNPALMVKKQLVDRTILLQKKVKDDSTQMVVPNPTSPGNPSLAWGSSVLPPAPSSHAIAEKLDAVQTETQKLSPALHMLLERQSQLEWQQKHQQRLQQEVLVTLQQLSSTVSHGTVPANQPCIAFSSMAKPSPTMSNFSQFKMELI